MLNIRLTCNFVDRSNRAPSQLRIWFQCSKHIYSWRKLIFYMEHLLSHIPQCNYMHLHSRFPSISTTENVKLKESHTSFQCRDILDSRFLALQQNILQRNFWTSTKRISEITRLKNRIDLIDKSIRNGWSVDVADSQ